MSASAGCGHGPEPCLVNSRSSLSSTRKARCTELRQGLTSRRKQVAQGNLQPCLCEPGGKGIDLEAA